MHQLTAERACHLSVEAWVVCGGVFTCREVSSLVSQESVSLSEEAWVVCWRLLRCIFWQWRERVPSLERYKLFVEKVCSFAEKHHLFMKSVFPLWRGMPSMMRHESSVECLVVRLDASVECGESMFPLFEEAWAISGECVVACLDASVDCGESVFPIWRGMSRL